MNRVDLVERLVEALGHACVLTGERLGLRQTSDWTHAGGAVQPLALLLPRSTEDVATAVRICREHGCPIAVQGGLTGLAGGANPMDGEIALSLARLDRIEELDAVGGIAIVQAGVTLERLQQACAEQGWTFPLDLGARGSCQLGGNAATNAGGNRALRYGTMRNLVLGLEVVLADGTVLTMLDRVIKNNAGFDLKHLFIGSEGTHGVITRLSLLRQAKVSLQGLSAFEVMWDSFFDASIGAQGRRSPLAERYPAYVLVECFAGEGMDVDALMEAFLARAIERGLVADAVVAQTGAQQEALWAIREDVSELLAMARPCAAFDVSVAIVLMDELVRTLEDQLRRAFPAQHHLFFGHLGDGNLHLISGPYPDPQQLEIAEEMVYGCVGKFRGSISAEHGIGVVKRDFLHHSRADAEVALMRRLKEMLDPQGILNPGRVFERAAAGSAVAA